MKRFIEQGLVTAEPVRLRRLSILLFTTMLAVAGERALPAQANVVTPTATPLSGTEQLIAGGPGDQVNPHIDCNLASYTFDTGVTQEIHYFDFTTNADHIIPTSGLAFLSDVNGTRIVFTNVTGAGSQIALYDTASGTTSVIPGGNLRTNPEIGGNTVAFEDRSFSSDPNQSEIVVYDVATGTTSRLTNDTLMDTNPAVSPNGNVVVWEKCQTNGFNCDIYEAIQTAPGVWSTTALTGAAGDETNPETNGIYVVYTSVRGGEQDVYYQPVGGGTETQLSIPGDQRNPSISGNLISFESQVGTEYDIFVYDITTGKLYQVTNTPVDEVLNDNTVCGGIARVVYSAPGSSEDVFAFSFQPPSSSVTFASFSGKLDIAGSSGSFDLNGAFTLGAQSNGINPLAEDVTLQIGPYSVTIPKGFFTQNKKGAYAFQGTISGVPLQIKITANGVGSYTLQAQGSGANLNAITNPVRMSLTIGDDTGAAPLKAQIS